MIGIEKIPTTFEFLFNDGLHIFENKDDIIEWKNEVTASIKKAKQTGLYEGWMEWPAIDKKGCLGFFDGQFEGVIPKLIFDDSNLYLKAMLEWYKLKWTIIQNRKLPKDCSISDLGIYDFSIKVNSMPHMMYFNVSSEINELILDDLPSHFKCLKDFSYKIRMDVYFKDCNQLELPKYYDCTEVRVP